MNPGKIEFENNQRRYYNTFESFNTVSSNWIDSNCNAIAFWNRGTSNVLINNVILLLPLDFVTINGNQDEIDVTRYIFSFQGTGTDLLIVVRKTYQ